jgi:hypothetical protein
MTDELRPELPSELAFLLSEDKEVDEHEPLSSEWEEYWDRHLVRAELRREVEQRLYEAGYRTSKHGPQWTWDQYCAFTAQVYRERRYALRIGFVLGGLLVFVISQGWVWEAAKFLVIAFGALFLLLTGNS